MSVGPSAADIDQGNGLVSFVPSTSDIPHAERLNKSRPWAALNSILSIGDQAIWLADVADGSFASL
jgi:hypothetical protein